MINIQDIKIKKDKLKELAKKSVLFSASNGTLDDFLKAVDSIEENEQADEYLDFLVKRFEEEKEEVSETYKNLFVKE